MAEKVTKLNKFLSGLNGKKIDSIKEEYGELELIIGRLKIKVGVEDQGDTAVTFYVNGKRVDRIY